MCDILAAISYGYGYHQERPRKRVKINMTIPSRPAPPPPQQRTTASRYTPTTDWDFCTFGSSPASPADGGYHHQQPQTVVKTKKPPPPRPPPPKLHPPNPSSSSAIPALKKPAQPQSINILSSLFGQKRSSNGSGVQKTSSSSCVPIKLLPPPPPAPLPAGSSRAERFNGAASYGGTLSTGAPVQNGGEMQLITFDSPPSSPTFTQKSCSDCISVDSFSSDSNYSSPAGGNMSQAESGFEDDFVASGRLGSGVPWGDAVSSSRGDPFESSHHPGAGPLIYAPLPLATAQVRAPLHNSKLQQSDFVDPLCNGRSATSKVPLTVSMPTIIKPPSATAATGSQKSTPVHSRGGGGGGNTFLQKGGAPTIVDRFAPEVDAFDSLPSLPMPTIPPPPPPPQSVAAAASVHGGHEEAYGIALYDFEGETVEDLSLKVNEKIYLLRRLNAEWFMGRDRRGLEGMFPVSYVDVKVPLSDATAPDPAHGAARPSDKVRALYHFAAETAEDLTLVEDDLVTVLYQITPEWLYGATVDGRKGQFPANFIEYVPKNLPPMPAAAGVC
ncbi:uncharacterized protein LOC128274154 [Anopheles cruzii]|uniref:uncharacterized protein LOC128274154 n=1 Tax=Anopheles cruzii TaxID=68878 RepID=UPI0022EC26DB|nr:uncharacterized protein LOC128274154 [Anopheles cruzii]